MMRPGSLHKSSLETNNVADIALDSLLAAEPPPTFASTRERRAAEPREGRRSHDFVSTRERRAAEPLEERRSHDFIPIRERRAAAPPREKGR